MKATPEQRARLYLESMIDGVVSDVAGSGEGGRDDTLNRAAYQVGRHLWLCPELEGEAARRLFEAIQPNLDAVQNERWAEKKLARGIEQGRRQPRQRHELPDFGLSEYQARTLQGERAATQPIPHTSTRATNPPPVSEVNSTWSACLSVDAAVDVKAWDHDPLTWLHSRGIDPDTVAAYDLVRMIPDGIELPAWAGSWSALGYRLVVQAFDSKGQLASLHARYTRPGEATIKARWPTGYSMKGLVMANPVAVAMLQGKNRKPGKVVLCEGIPDFLTAATRLPGATVFGFTAGSWQGDHAQCIPDGSTVYIMADSDAAGTGYRDKITATFAGRHVELRGLDPEKVRASDG